MRDEREERWGEAARSTVREKGFLMRVSERGENLLWIEKKGAGEGHEERERGKTMRCGQKLDDGKGFSCTQERERGGKEEA